MKPITSTLNQSLTTSDIRRCSKWESESEGESESNVVNRVRSQKFGSLDYRHRTIKVQRDIMWLERLITVQLKCSDWKIETGCRDSRVPQRWWPVNWLCHVQLGVVEPSRYPCDFIVKAWLFINTKHWKSRMSSRSKKFEKISGWHQTGLFVMQAA